MQTWHLLAAGRAPLKRCQKVEGPGLSGLMIDFPINHWVVEKEGRRRNPHVSFAAAAVRNKCVRTLFYIGKLVSSGGCPDQAVKSQY